MPKAKTKQKYRVTYNVALEITYEIEAADEAEALKDARDHGHVVDESWASCDLDHVEQVSQA